MKGRGKALVLVILAVLIFVLGNTFISARKEDSAILNGTKIDFPDSEPYMDAQAGKEFVIQGIGLGESEEKLISDLGEPDRKDLSEYGFYWYIYNKNYSKYIQVGVKDSTVVGIYTNADNWKSAKGIGIGMKRASVERLLGKPLQGITKNMCTYLISAQDEKGIYLQDGSYVTIFYDIHNENTVTALQIVNDTLKVYHFDAE